MGGGFCASCCAKLTTYLQGLTKWKTFTQMWTSSYLCTHRIAPLQFEVYIHLCHQYTEGHLGLNKHLTIADTRACHLGLNKHLTIVDRVACQLGLNNHLTLVNIGMYHIDLTTHFTKVDRRTSRLGLNKHLTIENIGECHLS